MAELGLSETKNSELLIVVSKLLWPLSAYKDLYTDDRFTGVVGFAATNPTTLGRRNFSAFQKFEYAAVEKSAGTRYLLFIRDNHNHFLISRRNQVYALPPNTLGEFVFPPSTDPSWVGKPLTDTLLDGELLRNLRTQRLEFHIFDGIAIAGDSQLGLQTELEKRRSVLRTWVMDPHIQRSREKQNADQPKVLVCLKRCFGKNEASQLLASFTKEGGEKMVFKGSVELPQNHECCHVSQGLLLVPLALRYSPLKSDSLFLWRFPCCNTVCFCVKLRRLPNVTLLFRGGSGGADLVEYRDAHFGSHITKNWTPKEMHNAVIECSYDLRAGEWRFIRRVDTEPSKSTYVVECVETTLQDIKPTDIVELLTGAPVEDSTLNSAMNSQARQPQGGSSYMFEESDNEASAIQTTTPTNQTKQPNQTQGNGSHASTWSSDDENHEPKAKRPRKESPQLQLQPQRTAPSGPRIAAEDSFGVYYAEDS